MRGCQPRTSQKCSPVSTVTVPVVSACRSAATSQGLCGPSTPPSSSSSGSCRRRAALWTISISGVAGSRRRSIGTRRSLRVWWMVLAALVMVTGVGQDAEVGVELGEGLLAVVLAFGGDCLCLYGAVLDHTAALRRRLVGVVLVLQGVRRSVVDQGVGVQAIEGRVEPGEGVLRVAIRVITDRVGEVVESLADGHRSTPSRAASSGSGVRRPSGSGGWRP